ncbi:hypothetical protein [Teredinibacter turnerae]|uniref:hypothetical protein n=1 Tax=Teredinibacter turnerae TaxID=2426 RepID=UPI0039B0BDB2
MCSRRGRFCAFPPASKLLTTNSPKPCAKWPHRMRAGQAHPPMPWRVPVRSSWTRVVTINLSHKVLRVQAVE